MPGLCLWLAWALFVLLSTLSANRVDFELFFFFFVHKFSNLLLSPPRHNSVPIAGGRGHQYKGGMDPPSFFAVASLFELDHIDPIFSYHFGSEGAPKYLFDLCSQKVFNLLLA